MAFQTEINVVYSILTVDGCVYSTTSINLSSIIKLFYIDPDIWGNMLATFLTCYLVTK